MSSADRSTIARIAALQRWAYYEKDRNAATAPARRRSTSSLEYWYPKVDPKGELTPEQRIARAEAARSAFYQGLARKGREAAAAKRAARLAQIEAALEKA